MKTARFLQFSLIFILLLFARQASANCMWTLNNECKDIGKTNNWASSTTSNCDINNKPNGNTAKCCCAGDVLGCCKKTNSGGQITTEDTYGEDCLKKTGYASLTFIQDSKAQANSCVAKNTSGCAWKYGKNDENDFYDVMPAKANCASDETATNYNKCGNSDRKSEGYFCCCKSAPLPTFTPPKFILPDFQIPIPNLGLSPIDYTNNGDGTYAISIPWIGQYISGIYNYGVGVAGILAAIILMAGGVLWLISAGDASKITQAKELITGSVIGLIILMTSYLLLYTVNPELTKFPPITIGAIQRMEFPEGDIATDSVSAIRKSTTRIVIHTAAGLGNRNEVDAFHKSKGWKGIGYNVYIERSGVAVMGRGEDTVGAHSLKYNSTSIGISYAGCAEKTQMNNKTIEQALKNNTITQTQLNTLIEKIKYYQKKYNIPRNMVIGHYEEPVSKACPCLPMDELRKLINP